MLRHSQRVSLNSSKRLSLEKVLLILFDESVVGPTEKRTSKRTSSIERPSSNRLSLKSVLDQSFDESVLGPTEKRTSRRTSSIERSVEMQARESTPSLRTSDPNLSQFNPNVSLRNDGAFGDFGRYSAEDEPPRQVAPDIELDESFTRTFIQYLEENIEVDTSGEEILVTQTLTLTQFVTQSFTT